MPYLIYSYFRFCRQRHLSRNLGLPLLVRLLLLLCFSCFYTFLFSWFNFSLFGIVAGILLLLIGFYFVFIDLRKELFFLKNLFLLKLQGAHR